jgi:hypothetical protein
MFHLTKPSSCAALPTQILDQALRIWSDKTVQGVREKSKSGYFWIAANGQYKRETSLEEFVEIVLVHSFLVTWKSLKITIRLCWAYFFPLR